VAGGAQKGRKAAETLCTSTEIPVLSFKTERGSRTMSVCEGANSSYLVYRFGPAGRIDLQYPAVAGAKSWELFEFSGYSRGGGASNDGMGDYSLRFANRGAVYTVFQNWRVENNEYQLGILLEVKGERIVIKGDAATQIGSLVSLENNRNIRNTWWQ
jgi:hypothetical protein